MSSRKANFIKFFMVFGVGLFLVLSIVITIPLVKPKVHAHTATCNLGDSDNRYGYDEFDGPLTYIVFYTTKYKITSIDLKIEYKSEGNLSNSIYSSISRTYHFNENSKEWFLRDTALFPGISEWDFELVWPTTIVLKENAKFMEMKVTILDYDADVGTEVILLVVCCIATVGLILASVYMFRKYRKFN